MIPAMRIVHDEPKQKDPTARIEELRRQLLAASVRYVVHGKDMTRAERLRQASNLSGIPTGLIEAECKAPQR